MSNPANHDAYNAAAAEHLRPSLVHIRAQLANALPDAEEIVKYNMPGFAICKEIFAGYVAFTNKCGLYLEATAISAEAEAIAEAGLKVTKTGGTFPPNKPIPDALIARLAKASRRDLGV